MNPASRTRGVALLPCPFCGATPTMPSCEPWHGGSKTKQLISCENDDCKVCPAVSGATAKKAAEYWNQRVEVTR